jgi:hypothetical protein
MSASNKRKTKFDEVSHDRERLGNPDDLPAEEFIGVPLSGEMPEWHPPEVESKETDEWDELGSA